MRFHKMELHYHTVLTAYKKQIKKQMEKNGCFASLIIHGFKIHQYKIYSLIRMPSKILVGGSCQARVINNLQS